MQSLFQRQGGTAGMPRNPLAEGGNISERISTLFGTPGGPLAGQAGSALMGFAGDTGQGLIDAYQPIFQRNLGLARDQGARFSSGNELLRTQALNDFNMFAAQTQEAARNRALQAALGAGQLGLGQGAQQGALLEQLLGALFKGGGINAEPVFQQSGGGFGSFLGGVLGTGLGALTGGLGSALGGKLGSSLFGGGGPAQYSGDPFNPFGAG
jgi:hypothetical protein